MEKKSELTTADLALYIGCARKTHAWFGVIDAVSRERIRVEIEFQVQGYVLPPDDVTPILRPLSDITNTHPPGQPSRRVFYFRSRLVA